MLLPVDQVHNSRRCPTVQVIGYIASHFRKDKIWMRRTRPDKRTYQVQLVAGMLLLLPVVTAGCRCLVSPLFSFPNAAVALCTGQLQPQR